MFAKTKKAFLVVGMTLVSLLSNLSFAEAAKISFDTKEVIQNKITESKAKEIALKQVKGTVTKVELETENGVLVYEVKVKAPIQVYEVKIDANSGKVLKVESEND